MLENRVRDVTTTTGLGAISLANTPPTGAQSFSGAGIPSGSTVRYEENDGAGSWEIWTGVFTTGPDQLTKVTLEASSTGSAINWPAGAKSVFITPSARDLVYQLPSFLGTTGGTANAQTLTPATKLTAYRGGYFFRATIGGGLTNTGPTTFNISSVGTRNVKRWGPGGKIALGGAELVATLTYEFFDDGTDIIVLNPSVSGPPGAGIVSLVSSTSIKFAPKNGQWVMINGLLRPIPSAGISAANTSVYVNGVAGQNLAASTVYLVTLFDNAGTPTIDFKTTLTHAPSTTAGNIGTEIWNSDDTRSVIGMVRTNASSQFEVSNSLIGVISWFNRREIQRSGTNTGGGGTTSSSSVEITGVARVNFICWADEDCQFFLSGTSSGSIANLNCIAAIGVDGSQVGLSAAAQNPAAGQSNPVSAVYGGPFADGGHFAAPLGAQTGGGTANFTMAVQVKVRG